MQEGGKPFDLRDAEAQQVQNSKFESKHEMTEREGRNGMRRKEPNSFFCSDCPLFELVDWLVLGYSPREGVAETPTKREKASLLVTSSVYGL